MDRPKSGRRKDPLMQEAPPEDTHLVFGLELEPTVFFVQIASVTMLDI